MKRILSVLTVFVILFGMGFVINASALNGTMTIKATTPASDGTFQVQVYVSQCKFTTFQFQLAYDINAVRPVSAGTTTYSQTVDQVTEPGEDISPIPELDGQRGAFISNSQLMLAGFMMSEKDATSTPYLVYTIYFKKVNPSADTVNAKFGLANIPMNAVIAGNEQTSGYNVTVKFEIPPVLGTAGSSKPVIDDPTPPSGGGGGGGGGSTTPAIDELTQVRRTRVTNVIIMQVGNPKAAVNGKYSQFDPSDKNVAPFVQNNRTYVPVRFIAENLGYKVDWNAKSRVVTITVGTKTVKMTVGNVNYTINGKSYKMDATPLIKNNRTRVPIRFVMEALGKAVTWEPNEKFIIVTPVDKAWNLKSAIEQSILDHFGNLEEYLKLK